jgi:hypothetical protein
MPLVSGVQVKGEAECEEATAMGRTSAQLLVRLRPCVQLSCEDNGGRGAASIEEEGVWR